MTALFPFGQAVVSRAITITGPRPLFVLGTYPSALHVRWQAPASAGDVSILAMPVDNEPEPFWAGENEAEHIESWKARCGYQPSWGSVATAAPYNGSAGVWLDQNVFASFDVTRRDAWITDCLDTYHVGMNVRRALEERFAPFARAAGLAQPQLAAHPGEGLVMRLALNEHRPRLESALTAARPEIIVTLGNAALRVVRRLVGIPTWAPRKLTASRAYGRPVRVEVDGRRVTWYPLAHPASPAIYQHAHDAWTAK